MAVGIFSGILDILSLEGHPNDNSLICTELTYYYEGESTWKIDLACFFKELKKKYDECESR